ncbi:MAG: RNase P subunit p30 family protein [Candidatus Woesearchaeota archaeon]
MPADLVFPDNNEKEFVMFAERLGYTKLYFAYNLKQKIPPLPFDTKIDVKPAVLSPPRDVRTARKASNFVIVHATDDIRYVLEKEKPSLVFGLEDSTRKDFMHYRNSGLNHFSCSLLAKNDVLLGISLHSLLCSDEHKRIVLLGRLSQNIDLCRKYGAKPVLASFARSPFGMRSPHDLFAFAITLGMSTKQAKDALEF